MHPASAAVFNSTTHALAEGRRLPLAGTAAGGSDVDVCDRVPVRRVWTPGVAVGEWQGRGRTTAAHALRSRCGRRVFSHQHQCRLSVRVHRTPRSRT